MAARCHWLGHNGEEEAARILAFLDSIGIAVAVGDAQGSLLPGITVRCGRIIIDPAVPAWPGDLLHDAGHIAVTPPEDRYVRAEISHDPAEEMGAIAWSVAAAAAIDIPVESVFHDAGYRGGSDAMITSFRDAPSIGVPWLAWLGMTAEPHRAAESGIAAFPAMQRWLR